MPDQSARDRAGAAARAWGVPQCLPRRVSAGRLAIFDVTLADGRRIALRLHPAHGPDRSMIDTRMKLAETLADAGFATAWPQRTTGGILTDTTTGICASALQWIAARPLDLAPAGPARVAMLQALGALLADLHLTADAVVDPIALAEPPDPRRQGATVLAQVAALRRAPDMTDGDRACLDRFADAARATLAALTDRPTGLVHGDPTPGHVLCAPDGLYLIGLDRSKPGWRAQDLAAALWPHVGAPDLQHLSAALRNAYIAGGGAASDATPAQIALFLTLHALAAAGAVDPGDPNRAAAVARAIAAARAWPDRTEGAATGGAPTSP